MWWTGQALGFDLETDGKDPLDARIITAAMVRVMPGVRPDEMEVMLQPERDIPAEAVAIHGVTTEHAREHGQLREVAIPSIAATLAEVLGPEVPLVGHNASYDLTVLDREMRRIGIGNLAVADNGFGQVRLMLGGAEMAIFPVIDTYVLDKALDQFRPGSRKLADAAAEYGVPMAEGSAHGATADVIAALRIAITMANRCGQAADYMAANGEDPMVFRMHPFMQHYAGRRDPLNFVRRFATLSTLTIADLHQRQVQWAREQAESLREHFIRKPDKGDPDKVDGSWPLRTLTDGASKVETISTELV